MIIIYDHYLYRNLLSEMRQLEKNLHNKQRALEDSTGDARLVYTTFVLKSIGLFEELKVNSLCLVGIVTTCSNTIIPFSLSVLPTPAAKPHNWATFDPRKTSAPRLMK